MALLWIEGFENFGTTLDAVPAPAGVIGRKYAIVGESAMRVAEGRLGGSCLMMTAGNGRAIDTPALTTDSTMIVGIAFKTVQAHGDPFLMLYDGASLGMNVVMTIAGELAVRLGSGVLATTSGLNLLPDHWYFIEFKVVCGNSPNGSYELRVGGATVLTDSGLDTQPSTHSYHTHMRIQNSNDAGASGYYDDWYICDGSGSQHNDFLGNQKVITLRPNGDTAAKDFTPQAGSDNYAMVDEAECDDDTTYVESGTAGQKDLYDYQAPSGLASITGVMASTDCRETDATSYSLVTVCKSGATESDDSAQPIATTEYTTKTRVLSTDPNTDSAWTDANLASAQFGVKIG